MEFTRPGNGGMIFVGIVLALLWTVGLLLSSYRIWRLLREREQPLAVVYLPLKLLMLVSACLYCVVNVLLGDFFWYTSTNDASLQIAFTVLGEGMFRPIMILSLCQLLGNRLSSLTQAKGGLLNRCGGVDGAAVGKRNAVDDCMGTHDNGVDGQRDGPKNMDLYHGLWRPGAPSSALSGSRRSNTKKGRSRRRGPSAVSEGYYAPSNTTDFSEHSMDGSGTYSDWQSPNNNNSSQVREGALVVPTHSGSVPPQGDPADPWSTSLRAAPDPAAASTSDVASLHNSQNNIPQSSLTQGRSGGGNHSDTGSTVGSSAATPTTPRGGNRGAAQAAAAGDGGDVTGGGSNSGAAEHANTGRLIALWHTSVASAKAYLYGSLPPGETATDTTVSWERGASWSSVLGTRLTLVCLIINVPIYIGIAIGQSVNTMGECLSNTQTPPSDADSCVALVASNHYQALRPRILDTLAFFSYGVLILCWSYCGVRFIVTVSHHRTRSIAIRRFALILIILLLCWICRFLSVLDFARIGGAIAASRFFSELSEIILVIVVAVNIGTVSGRSWGPKVQGAINMLPQLPSFLPASRGNTAAGHPPTTPSPRSPPSTSRDMHRAEEGGFVGVAA